MVFPTDETTPPASGCASEPQDLDAMVRPSRSGFTHIASGRRFVSFKIDEDPPDASCSEGFSLPLNAQQEAVAFWKFLESRGIQPSVRRVVAMMRAAMIPIDDRKARGYLEKFAAAAPHPKAIHHQITAQAPQLHSTPAAQTQHGHGTDEALTCADKVSLSTKPIPTGVGTGPEPLSLLGSVVVSEEPKSEKPVKPRRVPSAADLAAYALLSALWERIGPLDGYTRKDWSAHNKRTALSMLASGVAEAEWLGFWDEAADAGFRYVKLANMQANYASRSARHRDVEPEGEQYQSVEDLIAAGKVDADGIRADVEAERPKWFTPQMAEA